MSKNPFLSEWLSGANAASGAWRGFWTAEMARQQAALITEWQRQAMQFWTGAWARAVPAMAAATPTPAAVAEMAMPAPAEPVPATAEEATEPKPARPAKRPVQLRAAVERRKASAKPVPAKSAKRARARITRH